MSLNVCRGCLIESNNLKNIFSLKIEIDYVHNLNFSDCFQICTGISIERSDNLPQNICDLCIDRLVAAYKYRTQCKKSDLKLRSKTTNNVVSVITEDHNTIDSTCEISNPTADENFDDENDMIIEKLEEDFYEEFDENCLVPETELKLEPSQAEDLEGGLQIPLYNSVEHEDNDEHTDINNKYHCKICGQSMENRHKFLYHMRLHRPNYPCTICPRKFIREAQLKEHYKIGNHSNKKIKCSVCEEEIGEDCLAEHMHIHTNEKPFKCKICNKAFRFRSAVNSHMWTHKESHELPFECTICSKRFGFKTLFRDHMRIHNKERAYQCDLCPKNYLRSSALHAHRRRHGNYKIECEICKKQFSTESTLKKHSYIHTGHLFTCPECVYSCSRRHRMKQHVLKHHNMEWEPDVEYESVNYLEQEN